MNGGAAVPLDVPGLRSLDEPDELRDRSELGTESVHRELGADEGNDAPGPGGTCSTAGNNPCKGNFGGFNQMVYAADDDSGPVATLKVLDSGASISLVTRRPARTSASS